jgi:hypothetical protein
MPADIDQVVSPEIRVVNINAGKPIYLNIDEPGARNTPLPGNR